MLESSKNLSAAMASINLTSQPNKVHQFTLTRSMIENKSLNNKPLHSQAINRKPVSENPTLFNFPVSSKVPAAKQLDYDDTNKQTNFDIENNDEKSSLIYKNPINKMNCSDAILKKMINDYDKQNEQQSDAKELNGMENREKVSKHSSVQPINNATHFTDKQNTENRVLDNQTLRVRAIISGWKAGMIIGRHGTVINSLRQASNCKIVMSADPTNPDRILSITGSYHNVTALLTKICYLLSLSPHYDYTLHYHDTNNSDEPFAPDASETYTLHFILAVPSVLCGYLIGKRGSKIKEFREKYQVLFSVSPSLVEKSNDRPVTISGYFGNVADCLREVCKYLVQPEEYSYNPDTSSKKYRDHSTKSIKNVDAELNAVNTESPKATLSSEKNNESTRNNENLKKLPSKEKYNPAVLSLSKNSNLTVLSKKSPPSIYYQQQKSQTRYTLHNKQVKYKPRFQKPSENRISETTSHENQVYTQSCNASNNNNNDISESTKISEMKNASKEPQQRSSSSEQNLSRLKSNKLKSRQLGSNQATVVNNNNDEALFGSFIKECSFFLDNGDIEVHLLVPNDIVGCIIGKCGRTISEIREASGAYISITDSIFPPEQPPNAVGMTTPTAVTPQRQNQGNRRNRVIVIRGNRKAVQVARYLMGTSILSAQRYGVSVTNSELSNDF